MTECAAAKFGVLKGHTKNPKGGILHAVSVPAGGWTEWAWSRQFTLAGFHFTTCSPYVP
jgi:hypothetical protein